MAKRLTVQSTQYPWPIRIADCGLRAATSVGLGPGPVTAEGLMAEAMKSSGLSDFGDDSYREGMDRVLDNIDTLGFSQVSRQITRATYAKALGNRLQYQNLIATTPEILHIPVERPIFVLGFPRTGTTLLQNLLALHPQRRGLEFWELISPYPRHANPKVDERTRRRIATAALTMAYAVAPEMKQVHDVRIDTLEECWYLFVNSFKVLNWDLQTGLESYGEWLLSTDMTSAYQDYRGWLQALLHQRPADNLVLKCPEHLWFIDALLKVFPDACIVWTHRDPVASVASYGSLMALTRRMVYGHFEPAAMGPYLTQRFHEGVSRAMEARAAWGNEQTFYDVNFSTLVKDPIAVVKDICTHFDLGWSPDYPAMIKAWQDSDREDKRGQHVYSAKAFNVDPVDVHARFADYIERFQIPIRKDHT